MRFTEAKNLTVISRSTAEKLGEIRRLVIDPGVRRVVAVQVSGRRKGRVASWDRFTGFGPDAAVVDADDAVRDPTGDREERTVKGDLDPLDKLVLTDRGDACGKIRDIEFDAGTGELLTLITEQDPIDGSRLRAIGSYAVIVFSPSEH
ncbi:MAG: PRC-barrel domain-containing protein [Actinomycetota bacterium]